MPRKKKDDTPAEKKKPNRGSFTKESPPANIFPSGFSGNPGGKPREHRAFAKAARTAGAGRASDQDCIAIGLPIGSSKLQLSAERLVFDMSHAPTVAERLDCIREYNRLNNEYPSTKFAMGIGPGDPDFDGDGEFAPGPRLQIMFTQSPSDIERDLAVGRIIDRPSPQRDHDPDPAAEAARVEAAASEPEAAPQPALPAPPPDRESPWPAKPGLSRQQQRAAAYQRSGYRG